jgi:tetrahedral aminopeptidase
MAVDLTFLRDLCLSPGPTGYEAPVQQVLRARLAGVATASGDPLGNLWAEVNPTAGLQVAVMGHADQIGLLVTYVDERGYLSFECLGGVDLGLLPGRDLVVHNERGPVRAVCGRKPTHIVPLTDRGKAPELAQLFLDIGARSRKQALSRVAVGDPVTFGGDFIELGGGLCAGRAFDDRAGVYAAFRGLELYAARPGQVRFTAASTVQEETTCAGAKALTDRLRPQVVVVIDGDFASDTPAAAAKDLGGEVRLGEGPVLGRGACSNERLVALTLEVAKARGIQVQVKAYGGAASTDADELMAAGSAATLSLGIPVRYMHSPYEVVDTGDVEATAELIAALAVRVGETITAESFVPRV